MALQEKDVCFPIFKICQLLRILRFLHLLLWNILNMIGNSIVMDKRRFYRPKSPILPIYLLIVWDTWKLTGKKCASCKP